MRNYIHINARTNFRVANIATLAAAAAVVTTTVVSGRNKKAIGAVTSTALALYAAKAVKYAHERNDVHCAGYSIDEKVRLERQALRRNKLFLW